MSFFGCTSSRPGETLGNAASIYVPRGAESNTRCLFSGPGACTGGIYNNGRGPEPSGHLLSPARRWSYALGGPPPDLPQGPLARCLHQLPKVSPIAPETWLWLCRGYLLGVIGTGIFLRVDYLHSSSASLRHVGPDN